MRAAVATDVTVDLEVLDCTLCLSPLKPPVFQCAAGHVICSNCYEKLLENDYCQVCSINTSYNRCLAVERILQSVKVPCSNAGYGCAAKMPYHEMEEHEMNCLKAVCDFTGSNTKQPMPLQHGLPTDYYTLVFPKVSPSTSMNISINNRESKKMHDNKSSTCEDKSSTGSVVKMGPCGGGGGMQCLEDGHAWRQPHSEGGCPARWRDRRHVGAISARRPGEEDQPLGRNRRKTLGDLSEAGRVPD